MKPPKDWSRGRTRRESERWLRWHLWTGSHPSLIANEGALPVFQVLTIDWVDGEGWIVRGTALRHDVERFEKARN